MATKKPSRSAGPAATVDDVLAWLERRGSRRNVEGMARYGIVSEKVFGISVADLRRKAKEIGQDHALAFELWDTGWYEARMLAAFLADPAAITVSQMDRWARDFDNWAITDTACFSLFDRSPHAWSRVDRWAARQAEFVRRAGFALLASMALHDRDGDDADYRARLPLIRKHAADPRNFVKKGVSWALHSIGCRSPDLHAAALELALDLAASQDAAERWVGRDALAKLRSPATQKRVGSNAARRSKAAAKRARRGTARDL